MNISDKMKSAAMNQLYDYLDKDPDTNIPKALDWLEKNDKVGGIAPQVTAIKKP